MIEPDDPFFADRPKIGGERRLLARYGQPGAPIIFLEPSVKTTPVTCRSQTRPNETHRDIRTFIYARKGILEAYKNLGLYLSPAHNVVILAPTTTRPLRMFRAKHGPDPRWRSVGIRHTILPSLATSVGVYDVELHETCILFRWPRFLYRGTTHPEDRATTVGGQLRESLAIEAQFQPLGRRFVPRPFFVPTHTLDPVWAPADGPALADQPGAPRPLVTIEELRHELVDPHQPQRGHRAG